MEQLLLAIKFRAGRWEHSRRRPRASAAVPTQFQVAAVGGPTGHAAAPVHAIQGCAAGSVQSSGILEKYSAFLRPHARRHHLCALRGSQLGLPVRQAVGWSHLPFAPNQGHNKPTCGVRMRQRVRAKSHHPLHSPPRLGTLPLFLLGHWTQLVSPLSFAPPIASRQAAALPARP